MELDSRGLHSMLEKIFLNLKRLFDASVVLLTKNEYGSKANTNMNTFSINISKIFSINVW